MEQSYDSKQISASNNASASMAPSSASQRVFHNDTIAQSVERFRHQNFDTPTWTPTLRGYVYTRVR